MNIAIMRAFFRLREIMATHKELAYRLVELERRMIRHDKSLETLFATILRLMKPPVRRHKQIGFRIEDAK